MTNTASAYIDACVEQIKGTHLRVAFPESDDERIIQAANELAERDICVPVLLGARNDFQQSLHASVSVINPADDDSNMSLFTHKYLSARPKSKEAVARRLLKRPMFYAGMMVACDQADALIAGAASPTSKVIEAGLMTVGLADGITTPSSFFLMLLSGQRAHDVPAALIFADCAVNVDPDASTLADIAIASADNAARLFDTPPRVAMLSFSTHGSAQHACTDKVIAATQAVRERRPHILVDGELQADSALIAKVAATKATPTPANTIDEQQHNDGAVDGAGSECRAGFTVAGKANVLIFPTLDAGNIAYKLTQYLGGAIAIGPVLQGFARPVCDLSRGASVSDIVASTVLTLRLSQDRAATAAESA